MKSIPGKSAVTPSPGLAELQARLTEAEATLRAIRSGEVDAVVVAGERGEQVFTLEGAGHAYRMLIESMNEGALTLTTNQVVLYANQCFAKLVKRPLEQVMGCSFRDFVAVADQARLRLFFKRNDPSGAKIQVLLQTGGGSPLPVQISQRRLPKIGPGHAVIGLVVTDMTEARKIEQLLRALTRRVVEVQEAERGRVALELHDNITQSLCAVVFHSQSLVNRFPTDDGVARGEAVKLHALLGDIADEVTRISHQLHPSILDQLGLVATLRSTCKEFAVRTGLALEVDCRESATRLPADVELALFRILQEALANVEKHADAGNVVVSFRKQKTGMQLSILDDGCGFLVAAPGGKKGKGGLGLLSMRERASYVGGVLTISSLPGAGTKIDVRVALGALRLNTAVGT